MADHHDFCRVSLKLVREDARERGYKIPPISSAKLFDEHYAVYLGADWYDEYGSCCAFEARASAIADFMHDYRSPLNKSYNVVG